MRVNWLWDLLVCEAGKAVAGWSLRVRVRARTHGGFEAAQRMQRNCDDSKIQCNFCLHTIYRVSLLRIQLGSQGTLCGTMRLLQFTTTSGKPAGVRVGATLGTVHAAGACGDGAGAGGAGAGSSTPAVIVDLTGAFTASHPEWVRDGMRSFLEGGAPAMEAARDLLASAMVGSSHAVALGDIQLEAPIYNPEKVLCVGMNYTDHCTGV